MVSCWLQVGLCMAFAASAVVAIITAGGGAGALAIVLAFLSGQLNRLEGTCDAYIAGRSRKSARTSISPPSR